jgi:hypothetical protein
VEKANESTGVSKKGMPQLQGGTAQGDRPRDLQQRSAPQATSGLIEPALQLVV